MAFQKIYSRRIHPTYKGCEGERERSRKWEREREIEKGEKKIGREK